MAIGTFPLSNKIALVTGAGSGINFAFAKLAVLKGANVVIADLKLSSEAEEFVNSSGRRAVFAPCDVTLRKDLENLVNTSRLEFGDVPDVWIAGAGVFEPVRDAACHSKKQQLTDPAEQEMVQLLG